MIILSISMKKISARIVTAWKELKKQPIDVWFFYLFLLTFTLSIRKVIFFFPVKKVFNEYTGIYIYVSNIFLCNAVVVWACLVLRNNIANKSSEKAPISRLIHSIILCISSGFRVIHKLSTAELLPNKAIKAQTHKKCSPWNIFDWLIKYQVIILPFSLVAWSFLAVFWSENKIIGIYRSIKFLELYGLFVYISLRLVPLFFKDFFCGYKNVPCGTSRIVIEKKNIAKIILHFRAILLGFIFIMLFDHYLWDIWQGQVLFWLVCGVLAGIELAGVCKLNNCSMWNNVKQEFEGDQIVEKEVFGGIVIENVPRGTFSAINFWYFILIATGMAQALWGIAQFFMQRSIGFSWLKESLIGKHVDGVAKIIINNEPVVRAYGLFPHPNILGGFLFFSIIITLLYKKMFHVEQIEEVYEKNCSTWNNSSVFYWINVPRGTFMPRLIDSLLLIQLIGLALTFSKSAILALLFAGLYLYVPCGTFRWNKLIIKRDGMQGVGNCSPWNNFCARFSALFHMEQYRRRVLVVFSLVVGFLALFFSQFKFYSFFLKSLDERVLYLTISKKIILEWPIFGSGTGQFIIMTERIFSDLMAWQYQPVHNVFLLVWSDWGVVGLILLILFLWRLFHFKFQSLTVYESKKSPI